jgi:LysR family transcriptional regulator, nitrogen assimilation regulatory protein
MSGPGRGGGERLDHKQIRCFVAAAEAGSFSAASTDLHLAPSALSRHISNLEAETGVLLFERTRGGRVRLTDQGARLLPHAREVAYALDGFAQRARQEASGGLGGITIASVDWIGPALLPRVAARVQTSHRGVHITLVSGSWNDVLRNVLEGTADLAIVPDLIVDERLQLLIGLSNEMLLVSPAGEAPFGETCTMSDVLTLPAIAPPSDTAEFGLLMDIARRHGVEPEIVLEADLALWPRLVRRGEGHAVIPELAVRQESQLSGLTCSRIVDLPAEWSVVRRAGRTPPAVERMVIDVIEQEARAIGVCDTDRGMR